jgi:hypothetical protein
MLSVLFGSSRAKKRLNISTLLRARFYEKNLGTTFLFGRGDTGEAPVRGGQNDGYDGPGEAKMMVTAALKNQNDGYDGHGEAKMTVTTARGNQNDGYCGPREAKMTVTTAPGKPNGYDGHGEAKMTVTLWLLAWKGAGEPCIWDAKRLNA